MSVDERFTDEALEEYLLALDEHQAALDELDDGPDDWTPDEPGRITWSRTRRSYMTVTDVTVSPQYL